MDQIYEVTVFKTQGIKQRRTGIPGKWKPHEMNPQLAMAHCLGELLGVGGERRSWRRAWRSPWVEEMVLQVQGSWDSWSSWDGAPQRRGLPRKGAVEICRGFSLIVQKSPGPHIHMRKQSRAVKGPPMRIRCPHSHGEQHLFLLAKPENTQFTSHWVEDSERWYLSNGDN